jgi:hypothetical protein
MSVNLLVDLTVRFSVLFSLDKDVLTFWIERPRSFARLPWLVIS